MRERKGSRGRPRLTRAGERNPDYARVGMGDSLVRFGVAMERSLLAELDILVDARGVTRSEVLRDLVRAELVRSNVARGVPAVATLTLVYDHHVRELTERINDFQHKLGEKVRSTLHVHLDAHRCLEVVVLRGRSDELQRAAERLLATRGVTHGRLDIVTDELPPPARGKGHDAPHGHVHDPPADDGHSGPAHLAKPRKARAPSARKRGP
jgi:CopG family nickel-responsive transcriptional regulator